MKALQGYASDSDEERAMVRVPAPRANAPSSCLVPINLTPDVDTSKVQADDQARRDQENQRLFGTLLAKRKNHLSGTIEGWHMNSFTFDEQYHDFKNFGKGFDPAATNNQEMALRSEDQRDHSSYTTSGNERKRRQELLKKREQKGDAGSSNFLGPWAAWQGTAIP
jgi:hypothetical protein